MPAPTSPELETALIPPSGSIAVDTSAAITSEGFSSLSQSAQSALLSVSGIGTSTQSRISKILELVNTVSALQRYILDGTVLDNLADGAESSMLTVPNVGTSRFVRVVLTLGHISPLENAKIQIKQDAALYEISITVTGSEKRIEFNSIPASFVNGFTVVNHTGQPLAAFGNSIAVVAL